MDNPVDNSVHTWGPRPALVAAGWVLTGVAAATLAATAHGGDRPGTLLLALVTAGLLAFSAYGTVVRPRLSADADGIRLRTLRGTRRLDWSQVRVDVRTLPRLGRRVPVLELNVLADHGDPDEDRPTALGWIELGEDPREVYDVLERTRPRPSG
ncbi:PH domain-containing protein [Saccharomonospora iraqiensis]|uniref:PH domain-containing protein n=1 Tax=Saccharomonospora iraqiensis TaxID=52698 RepID=UPI001F2E0E80|nr:PH domain-containing protein [Saccharomonospora iraqiensis]